MTKPFELSKQDFVRAFELIKANSGSAGIDQVSIEAYEKDLKNNLYKLWNRMSSGTYFPPAVLAVPIPKKSGGFRTLGIPTVNDRVAQMVVKLNAEPHIEPYFMPDSYGYRPNKSALDAVAITRERCWKYAWVVEFDIVGLFDNISHDLLLKALNKHIKEKWIVLYVTRWLKAPIRGEDGVDRERQCGTPQGGVVSPLLSNLFLHYVFDKWMHREYPDQPWCRYADDGLVHCHTEVQAVKLLQQLKQRFEECGLNLHSDKTRIIYCKDSKRKGNSTHASFDFLGYTFRPRLVMNASKENLFVGFTPAISKVAQKSIRKKLRSLGIRNRADLSLKEIADWLNPMIRGWINYYGRFCRSMMRGVFRCINKMLMAWAMAKFKSLRRKKSKAAKWLLTIADRDSNLMAHWQDGAMGRFA